MSSFSFGLNGKGSPLLSIRSISESFESFDWSSNKAILSFSKISSLFFKLSIIFSFLSISFLNCFESFMDLSSSIMNAFLFEADLNSWLNLPFSPIWIYFKRFLKFIWWLEHLSKFRSNLYFESSFANKHLLAFLDSIDHECFKILWDYGIDYG